MTTAIVLELLLTSAQRPMYWIGFFNVFCVHTFRSSSTTEWRFYFILKAFLIAWTSTLYLLKFLKILWIDGKTTNWKNEKARKILEQREYQKIRWVKRKKKKTQRRTELNSVLLYKIISWICLSFAFDHINVTTWEHILMAVVPFPMSFSQFLYITMKSLLFFI